MESYGEKYLFGSITYRQSTFVSTNLKPQTHILDFMNLKRTVGAAVSLRAGGD